MLHTFLSNCLLDIFHWDVKQVKSNMSQAKTQFPSLLLHKFFLVKKELFFFSFPSVLLGKWTHHLLSCTDQKSGSNISSLPYFTLYNSLYQNPINFLSTAWVTVIHSSLFSPSSFFQATIIFLFDNFNSLLMSFSALFLLPNLFSCGNQSKLIDVLTQGSTFIVLIEQAHFFWVRVRPDRSNEC